MSTVAEILTSTGDRAGSYEWATPQAVFDKINRRWGPFTLDAAATWENAKCDRFFTKEHDALQYPWEGRVYVNPPYGRELEKWVFKAAAEVGFVGSADCVVMLIPARTDTRWWHQIVMPFAYRVMFCKGRIRFEQEGKDNAATFANVIVVFLRNHTGPPEFGTWEP